MKRPRVALGVCQILLAAAIAWTAYTLADALPNWPIDPLLAKSAVFNFQVDIMRCMWASVSRRLPMGRELSVRAGRRRRAQ